MLFACGGGEIELPNLNNSNAQAIKDEWSWLKFIMADEVNNKINEGLFRYWLLKSWDKVSKQRNYYLFCLS